MLPITLIILFPALVASCDRHDTTGASVEEAPPLSSEVIAAEERPWASRLEVTGGVEPMRRATPGTILMGRVEQVLRREGDRVRAGEVLARIESRDVAARLAQAEAAVAAARADEENVRLTKERMERLLARQAAPQKSADDARAGHAAALAALEAAEKGVEAARVHVAYSEVTAPFAGVVARRNVEAGDMAAPGQPLFVVEETSRVKVEAQVPESAVGGLERGDPVEVEIDAAPGAVPPGTLDEILPAADPRSRTFTVRVVIDNPDGAIRSGMFARLRLGVGTDTGAEAHTGAGPGAGAEQRAAAGGVGAGADEIPRSGAGAAAGTAAGSNVAEGTGPDSGERAGASVGMGSSTAARSGTRSGGGESGGARAGAGSQARLAVPAGAVIRRGPLTGLFVVEPDGRARLRWVSLGEERDGWVEILAGLAAGERLVAEPPAGLEDGRRVDVR